MLNDKPTNEQVQKYVEKLENLLSHLNIKVSVDLYDLPIEVTTTLNGSIQEKYNIWLKSLRISNPEVTDLDVVLYHRLSHTFNTENGNAMWQDAYDIQNFLYTHLKKKVGNPKEGDIYWKLWDKIK